MYAPVSRQIDAPFHQACAENGFSSNEPARACLSPAQSDAGHYQKAGLQKVSLVQTVNSQPAELGASLTPEAMPGSILLLLIAAVLLLIPALALGFISGARRPRLRG